MLHFRIDSLNQSERSIYLIQHMFGILAKHRAGIVLSSILSAK